MQSDYPRFFILHIYSPEVYLLPGYIYKTRRSTSIQAGWGIFFLSAHFLTDSAFQKCELLLWCSTIQNVMLYPFVIKFMFYFKINFIMWNCWITLRNYNKITVYVFLWYSIPSDSNVVHKIILYLAAAVLTMIWVNYNINFAKNRS